jgi:hypothetical protein
VFRSKVRSKREFRVPVSVSQMGRLAGFSYREVARRLRTFGFQFDRPGAGAEGTLRAILREAGINVSDFLKA